MTFKAYNYVQYIGHMLQTIATCADIRFVLISWRHESNPSNIHLINSTYITMLISLLVLQDLLAPSSTPKTTHTNPIMDLYFYCLPRLWNSLPIIDLSQSLEVIKVKLNKFLWNYFLANFDNTPCRFHCLCPCSRYSKTPAPSNYTYL